MIIAEELQRGTPLYIKINDLKTFYGMMDIPTIITNLDYSLVFSNDASKGHYLSEGFIPKLAIEATTGAARLLAEDKPVTLVRFEATSLATAISVVPIGNYLVFQMSNAPTFKPRIQNVFDNITEQLEGIFTLLPTILKFASVDSLCYESLDRVHKSCFAILRTVQNTQAMTEITSNINLQNEPINVTALLDDIAKAANESCDCLPEQVPVKYIGDTDDIFIQCDKDKFILAILNLISNSMIYSRDENTILIDCAATGENVVITVADRGMGINNDNLGSVLNPFSSKHPYDDEPGFPGLGLGLSLVREFTMRFKGAFSIESTEFEGTTVVLKFPRLKMQGTPQVRQQQKSFTGLIKNRFSPLYIQLSPICNLKWDNKIF